MVLNDDCLKAMEKMDPCSIDMAYLDPPFFTQRKQCSMDSDGFKYEFSDKWVSRSEYLSYIEARLLEVKRLLKDSGSIFLHCDSTSAHYLKVLLDKVFGESNFHSEIIWTYKRWSNAKKGLLAAHQTIFFYSKTSQYKFNTIYNDYSATTNIDQILQARARSSNSKASYKYDEHGNVVLGKEKCGVPLSDVWEIPFLNPKAKERTGYPTQKPIELLERIISISTDEDDIVLDPFCGSGTTLVAAKLLNRRYIGIDTNLSAINLCKARLLQPIKSESLVLKIGQDAYKTKSERELFILQQFDCNIVQRNCGIDAILKKHYLGRPVAIRIQKQDETVTQALSLLNKAGQKKQCSFLILIIQNNDYISAKEIPQNMIILYAYELEAERRINELVDYHLMWKQLSD